MAGVFKGWVAKDSGLPCVRVTVARGVADEVRARCAGREWVVWAGVGTGDDVLVSDPLAPVGVETTYVHGSSSLKLKRRGVGAHFMSDVLGGNVVKFRQVGMDQITRDSDLSSLSTSRGVADRWPLMAKPARYRLEILTDSADTIALRRLVAMHGHVNVFHDPSVCEVPDCDIDFVRRCVVVDASEERTERVDRAVRKWSLTLDDRSVVPFVGGKRDSRRLVPGPVVTWGAWAALGRGWQARSYKSLATEITGAV